ncbi:selenocysteine-specific translation elongation factor, partial [Kineococcus sp. T13]|uniref:SelB domain-containing protein n=1 Tax=Kineococcus vitellinus TaxID=2696565 RepID=UPI00196B06BA
APAPGRPAELRPLRGAADEASELRRRALVRAPLLEAMGVPVRSRPVAGDWHADPAHWARLGPALLEAVRAHRAAHPLQPGPSLEEARRALDLPDRALVEALVVPPLRLADGRVVERTDTLPPAVERAVEAVLADLARQPFAAPDVERLRELRLGRTELAAAVRAGRLERVADGLVLAPGYRRRAAELLARLPQPFATADARRALGTSRRVAVPLLEELDRAGITRRGADDRRTLTTGPDR